MAGLGVRLFTDEMLNPELAVALRRLGYDVVACHEVGRNNQGISDEAQLEYATGEGRAILTYNSNHFALLDSTWKAEGRQHAGIILSVEVGPLGMLIRRVQNHLDTYTPAEQSNTMLWLRPEP
jgi:hypothetical protein